MMKEFYQRHLPHYQPPEATYFVTFRLKNSLPKVLLVRLQKEREIEKRILQQLKDEQETRKRLLELQRRYFGYFETFLDRASKGPHWLNNPKVASIVCEALHHRDASVFDLLAYCIMPNHVHMIILVGRNAIPTYKPLFKILQSLKRHTARQANKLLKRIGAFWQDESYDHVIRDDDELEIFIRYVIENPVKAGLAKHWRDWRWTYVKQGFITELEL